MNGPGLPFAAVLALQGGVLLVSASVIVALARTRRASATITFAILATLACTSALVWIARAILSAVELPPEFTRRMVVADLVYVALPIAAVTLAALLLARRPSRPSVLSHWLVVVVIGFLTWPIAMALSRWLRVDMMNAVV